jgi:hypothetical protein
LGFGAVRGGLGAPLGGEVGCGPDMHNGNPSEDPNAKQCGDYATKHSPDAQRPRLSTRSVSFKDKRGTSVRAPRLLGLDVDAIGRAEAHSADGYRLVDVLASIFRDRVVVA